MSPRVTKRNPKSASAKVQPNKSKPARKSISNTKGKIPPHFIVFVPGFLGSMLNDRTTDETVWIDFSKVPLNPFEWEGWIDRTLNAIRYPNENLKPTGIVGDVVFAQPWIKQEQYSRLLTELGSMGYQVDEKLPEQKRNAYTFPYDWRQDNRISGRQLGQAIDRWSKFHPGKKPWLIAHSNGGIVSRWYIEKEGGKDKVGRLILIASPWDGAVKGMYMLFNGLDTLFRQRFNLFDIPRKTREVLRTFPSIYQLIPHKQKFLRDGNDNLVDPFLGQNWLDDAQHRKMLADAKKFNRELGTTLSVDTLVFFGRQQETPSAGTVRYDAGTHWSSIDWASNEQGDDSLTEHTAVFPKARQNIPVVANHGDIYVNPAVYQVLRWELVDQYTHRGVRALAAVEPPMMNLSPEHDTYAPGDVINVWATVENSDHTPVLQANIKVEMKWRQDLPGSKSIARSKKSLAVKLAADPQTPGRYVGQLSAPQADGYYRLSATLLTPGSQPIVIDKLIVVEAIN